MWNRKQGHATPLVDGRKFDTGTWDGNCIRDGATEEIVRKLKATTDQDEQTVHHFAPGDHPKA